MEIHGDEHGVFSLICQALSKSSRGTFVGEDIPARSYGRRTEEDEEDNVGPLLEVRQAAQERVRPRRLAMELDCLQLEVLQ